MKFRIRNFSESKTFSETSAVPRMLLALGKIQFIHEQETNEKNFDLEKIYINLYSEKLLLCYFCLMVRPGLKNDPLPSLARLHMIRARKLHCLSC